MKNLVLVVLFTVAATYCDPEVPNIVPAYAVSPLHHTIPPATINYNPSVAAKVSEHLEPVHAPVLKYTKTPIAVKAPLATSYATTTSVHVIHEFPSVHEPIFKYTEPAVPEVKFATEPVIAPIYKYAASAPVVKIASESVAEPIYKYTASELAPEIVAESVYKYSASTPIVKFTAESVAEPIYKYAASAPIVKLASETVAEPIYKYAASAPDVKFAAETIAAPVLKSYEVSEPVVKYPATPVLEHEGHSFDYAPFYSYGLRSLSSYH